MRILAVETSSSTASVTIHQDGFLMGEVSINNKKTHSQKLMPILERLMTDLDLLPSDIDYYAASIGPGSFTGLRIGVAAIKAIAFACDKPTVGVPTLDAMAYGLSSINGFVCPMIDARNNQVFTSLYQCNQGKVTRILDYVGITMEELVNILNEKLIDDLWVLGDGAFLHQDYLVEKLNKVHFAPAGLNLNRASEVALVATEMIKNGQTSNCLTLNPFYLRKSQAERMRDELKNV